MPIMADALQPCGMLALQSQYLDPAHDSLVADARHSSGCTQCSCVNAHAGHLENLFHHSGSTPLRWQSFSERSGPRPPDKAAEAGSLVHEYNEYCAGLLQHL